jgi:hypothetical protein
MTCTTIHRTDLFSVALQYQPPHCTALRCIPLSTGARPIALDCTPHCCALQPSAMCYSALHGYELRVSRAKLTFASRRFSGELTLSFGGLHCVASPYIILCRVCTMLHLFHPEGAPPWFTLHGHTHRCTALYHTVCTPQHNTARVRDYRDHCRYMDTMPSTYRVVPKAT